MMALPQHMPAGTVVAEVSQAFYERGSADKENGKQNRFEVANVDQIRSLDWVLLSSEYVKNIGIDIAHVDQARCLNWEELSSEPFCSEDSA